MPTPQTDPGTGIDLSSLGDLSNTANRLKLLELLQLQSQGKRNTNASILGDILKTQTDRKAAMADSYPEGSKYAAGFEPAGVFDAFSAFSKSMGGPGFQIDPTTREINPQHLDDMGSSINDALAVMKQITDANGDDNSVQTALMQALQDQLIPKTATGESKPGATGGAAKPFVPDDRQQGAASGAAAAGDIPYASGQGNQPSKKAQMGNSSVGGGASGNAGDILGGLTNLVGSLGIPNPFGSLSKTMGNAPGGNGGSGPTPEVASGDLSAAGTAAMVAQILQRAAQPSSPGKMRGTGVPAQLPSKLAGHKDGSQVFEGPTMIRVGERSPKDKKYATEEVVYAAPGTVVAPVPKGMENPSEEDAAGLLVAQILKSKKSDVGDDLGVKTSAVGSITTSATKDREGAMSGASNFTNQLSNYRSGQQQRQLQQQQMFINRDQTNRGMDIQSRGQDLNYDLGLKNWMLGNKNSDNNLTLGHESNSINRERNQNDFALGNRNLDLNFQSHQDEVRNWEAERALKRELGMRGLDIDQQKANQDYQLNSAQMAFQQIMAGISGSALPGVRAGRTPQLSLLG